MTLSIVSPLLSAQNKGMVLLTDYNTGTLVKYAGTLSNAPVYIPVNYLKKRNEFRGIWVATIENIDFPKHNTALEFQKKYLEMIRNIKQAGFTAIIFQIRPACDAFYPSAYAPYSKFISGKEGVGFHDFDPLRFMIDAAHRNGLEFHAWLNPYRVVNATPLSIKSYLKTLNKNNFAAKNPDLVLGIPTANNRTRIILNPGEPGAIKHILNIVEELISKYPLDAIHFDDYFYPYEKMGNQDSASYRKYGKGLSLDDWRRNNVDTLIQNVSLKIRKYNQQQKKSIRFGISPFGIWANKPYPIPANSKEIPQFHNAGSLTKGSQSFFLQHADTRRWIQEGWIDYIVPQLYWSFSHPVAAYAALADWWADAVRGRRVDLYIGHDVSRLGVNPDWKNPNELANQLKYNCRRPEIKGSCFFSYRRVFEPENPTQEDGVSNVVRGLWKSRLPGHRQK